MGKDRRDEILPNTGHNENTRRPGESAVFEQHSPRRNA